MIAVLLDQKLDRYVAEITYCIDFVFSTLGYDYRFITSLRELGPDDLLFTYGETEPPLEEVRLIARDRVMFWMPAETTLLDLNHLDPKSIKSWLHDITVHSKVPVFYRNDFDTPLQRIAAGKTYYGKFNLDLLGNIFYSLSACEDRITRRRDEWGRALDESSLLAATPKIARVNELLVIMDNFVKDALHSTNRTMLRKEFWPDGQKKAVSVSINIDSLNKWTVSSYLLSFIKDILILPYFTKSLPSLYKKLLFLFTNEEPYWNFDEILKIAKGKWPGQFSWFFGAESMHKLDVDYKISDEGIKDAMRSLQNSKHEIGLYASFDSAVRSSRLHREHKRLNALVGKEDTGVRQILYRYKYDTTWEFHEKSDVAYDSSVCWLESQGFKGGIAFPYKHYNIEQKRAFDFWELPLAWEDEKLYVTPHKYIAKEQAIQTAKQTSSTLNNCNGFMNYAFGISNFTDISYLGELFETILKQEADPDIWQATLHQIATWWQDRYSTILYKTGDAFKLKPAPGVERMCLQICGPGGHLTVSGATGQLKDGKIYLSDITPGNEIVITLGEPPKEPELEPELTLEPTDEDSLNN